MTNSKSAGFTLIELVIVIVILGVLAAVAAPRFIDLSEQAEDSALQAQASALASASAINFAAARGGSADASDVDDCSDVANLVDGWDGDSYSLDDSETLAPGESGDCTLTQESTQNTRVFQAFGVDTSG